MGAPRIQQALSLRYKYPWKLDEARKNLLRTHTTASSARALHLLAQKVGLVGRARRAWRGVS